MLIQQSFWGEGSDPKAMESELPSVINPATTLHSIFVIPAKSAGAVKQMLGQDMSARDAAVSSGSGPNARMPNKK